MATSDRIAFAALCVGLIAALLPLLWGALQWYVSLQSFNSVQAKELESQRGELDLIQEYVASRVAVDVRMGAEMASHAVRIGELERRVGEMERRRC